MSSLNALCSICTEYFKNTDVIYSTSCGHIFHFACMNDWEKISKSCPHCRHVNPTKHRIYLTFEESSENDSIQVSKMQEQVDASELKLLQLQKQNTISKNIICKLEERLSKSDNQYSKELTLALFEVGSLKSRIKTMESEPFVSILNIKINVLEQQLKQVSMDLEREILNCTQLSLENSSLKENQSQSKTMNMILSGKVKVLKQKLSHVSLELKNVISECTQLSSDNTKLKKILEEIESQSVQAFLKDKINLLEQKLKQFSLEFEKEISKCSSLTNDDKIVQTKKNITESQNEITTNTSNVNNWRVQDHVNHPTHKIPSNEISGKYVLKDEPRTSTSNVNNAKNWRELRTSNLNWRANKQTNKKHN